MKTYWRKGENGRNTQLCLLKKIVGSQTCKIKIAAKDVYQLFVNGRLVHYGPARAAKGYARVDCISLDKYLSSGENYVALYVLSVNTKTLSFAEGEPFVGVELYVGDSLFTAEDFEWFYMADRIEKTERTSAQRGYVEGYKMAADRTAFSPSAYIPVGFENTPCPKFLERGVGYSKNEEQTAELIESGSVETDGNELWHCGLTELLESGQTLRTYATKDCDLVISKELSRFRFSKNSEGELSFSTFALPYDTCGIFKIRLSVKERADIWLIYDDLLIDGKVRFNRESVIHGLKWTLAEGDYTLYSSEVYLAKYLCFVYSGRVEFSNVSIVKIQSPQIIERKDEIEDCDLREIYSAAQKSFEHNAYDLLTDCPSRERAGWLCDSYFIAQAEKFFTGDNKAEKNFLENYYLFTNEYFADDGIMPMCYPSVPTDGNDYIPNWILWYLIELEDYKKRTGDVLFVNGHKERVRRIIRYFEKFENEYGLLENLEGWVFVEWSKANDYVDGVNYPSNMLYYGALCACASILQDKDIVRKAEKLRKNIIEFSFNGTFFADNSVRVDGKLSRTDNITETCQNYAMFFKIFNSQEHKEFYERVIDGFSPEKENSFMNIGRSNMFIGYILRLCVLMREGYCQRLLNEIKIKFLPMAKRTGTIWELFSDKASCDHGFGSVVGKLIYEAYMLIKKEGE